jgi:hypothetical protein
MVALVKGGLCFGDDFDHDQKNHPRETSVYRDVEQGR